MTNFVKVFKSEEASNVLINEIEFISKKMETVDVNTLNCFEVHTKEIQAALDDLSRTIFETIDYCNQNTKIKNNISDSYKAKGLMYNILESSINTKLMIDDINEVNESLWNESVDSLIKIKSNIDRILMSLGSLLKKIKEVIDDRNFNPVEFVENLLNSYIVKPSEGATKKNNVEPKEKDNIKTKKEKEDSFDKKIILCLEALEKICKKYQFDISFYNLDIIKNNIYTGKLDNQLYIPYFQSIYNALCQNRKVEIEDKTNFEAKIIDAINFEENYCRDNSVFSEKQKNSFRDESNLFNSQSFKPRSYLNFV